MAVLRFWAEEQPGFLIVPTCDQLAKLLRDGDTLLFQDHQPCSHTTIIRYLFCCAFHAAIFQMSFKRKFTFGCALLVASASFAAPVMAETVARANGRCSLKEDGYQAFNGYCTVKQKQNGGTTVFVVDLDNGTRFRFSGPGRQQLHVETDSGIGTNVVFEDQGSKGVFTWNDGATTHRLAVKTDVVTNPNAQIDDHPSTATGATVAGALVGGLVSALLTGGKPTGGSGVEGQPVPELQSFMGREPGSVESRLTSTGYSYIRSIELKDDDFESLWKRGGTCVNVHRINNRYVSFTYSNPVNCN